MLDHLKIMISRTYSPFCAYYYYYFSVLLVVVVFSWSGCDSGPLPFLVAASTSSATPATKTKPTTTSTATGIHPVSEQYKAPNSQTPTDVATKWKTQDKELWDYVAEHVPAVLDHTGAASFDEHLRGVQAVLRYWNAPEYVASAGLFHSIYGTAGFQGFSLPLSERPVIKKLIGDKAEKLCFIFCMVDRSTVDRTVFDWKPEEASSSSSSSIYATFRSRPELGRFDIQVTKEEWLDFIELTLADWLEQVEGAAEKTNELFRWKIGGAYAYRRLAYRRMSQILATERAPRLSNVAPNMLKDVMDTESKETRHLIQPITPPQGPAAAAALDALRAIGENIPVNLSPRPVTSDDDGYSGSLNSDEDGSNEL